MDYTLFEYIVKEASKIGIQRICLNYSGEPTLHPRFADMISEVNKYKIPISFATNGIKLTDDIINALYGVNVKGINISLHNLKYIDTIFENIIKLKIKVNDRFIGATVEIDEHSDTDIKWLKDNCPCRVVLKPTIKDMYWDKFPDTFDIVPVERCTQANRSMYILWDGKVTICCHDIACEMAFGNISTNGLIGTWNSSEYIKIRTNIINSKFEYLLLCKKCHLWQTKFINKV
jgi:radical SAM protein with 4Fe4S-binding SPASM domain